MQTISSSKINIKQLKDQLKDRDYFETVVSPMQASKLFARFFLICSITFVILFLTSFLWAFLSNDYNSPRMHKKILDAKIGIVLAFFLFLLSSICFSIAKLNRNKTYTKAHQAYLKNPIICVLKALVRRGDIILYACAHNPNQQNAIEAILVPTLTQWTPCCKAAFSIILSEDMKYKREKMKSLEKKILKEAIELNAYPFFLNSLKLPEDKGEQVYFIYLKTGLSSYHKHYLRLML